MHTIMHKLLLKNKQTSIHYNHDLMAYYYIHVYVHTHSLEAPGDYQPYYRSITISHGSNRYLVSIPIMADVVAETLENFTVVLGNSSTNAVILEPTMTVIIVDGNGKN